jgi:hypothetical protein
MPAAPRLADRTSQCLLNWDARDCTLIPQTKQPLTFTRASGDAWAIDAQGMLRRVAHSAPRFEMADLDGDGIRETAGLLMEASRTNLLTYSNDLTQAAWTKNNATASVVTNPAAPDGGACSFLKEDNTTNTHYVFASGTITSGNYFCVQAFVKAGTRTRGRITGCGAAGVDSFFMDFNLSTLAFTGSTTGAGVLNDRGLEVVGGGWYRVWVSGLSSTTSALGLLLLADGTGATSYLGDNASGMYWWGANVQQFTNLGARIMSPIITTGASLTRSGDLLTGTINWLMPNNISIYIKAQAPLWKGEVAGTPEANAYTLRLSTTAPYIYTGIATGAPGGAPWMGFHDGTSGTVRTSVNLTSATPPLLEYCGQITNLLTAPQARLDIGNGQGFNAYSAAGLAIPALGNSTFAIGTDGSAQGYAAPLMVVKVASGLYTLDQMRGLW